MSHINRRERLRAIRDDLAARLESGELAAIAAVSAGAISADRAYGRAIAHQVVMEAYDAAYNHIPDDVGTFMVQGDLVQEFLEWMYDGKEKPEWIPD